MPIRRQPHARTSLARVNAFRRALQAVDLLRRPLTRAELAEELQIPDRTCVGLLRMMTDAGIPVLATRDGRVVRYQVEDPGWLGVARAQASSGTRADS